MRIFNKFVWSNKEPNNKNDIWFDGSVWKMFSQGEWEAFTVDKEAASKIAKLVEDSFGVYQEKLTAGRGITIKNNIISTTQLFQIVNTLPPTGEYNTIYLVYSDEYSPTNQLIEYIYVDNRWEKLGDLKVDIDLYPYLTKDEAAATYQKKEKGKVLSTNDYTNADKNKLASLKNYDDSAIKETLKNKVDKVDGKSLSTNDYTNKDKQKLNSLENYDDTEIRNKLSEVPFEKSFGENSAILKGGNNQTLSKNSVAFGKFNKADINTTYSVGIGSSDTKRKNAHEITNEGKHYILDVGDYDGTNPEEAKDLASVLEEKVNVSDIKGYIMQEHAYLKYDISNNVVLFKGFTTVDWSPIQIWQCNMLIAKPITTHFVVVSNNSPVALHTNKFEVNAYPTIHITWMFDGLKYTLNFGDNQQQIITTEPYIDNYYPDLSVGTADNLAGVEVVSSEFTTRQSGGGAITDGVARIEAIKGNSVVWNQLALSQGAKGSYDNSTEGSISYQSTGLLVNYTEQINGHKVFMSVIDKIGIIPYFYFTDNIQYNLLGGVIVTANTTHHGNNGIIARVPAGVNASWDIDCLLVDLTKMFGEGNEPSTIEEFYQRIPMGVDLHAYNEGEVIDMNVDGIKSVGVNAWDEQWERGTIIGANGTLYDDDTKIRTKNFIKVVGGKDYYIHQPTELIRVFFYDADKGYISYHSNTAPNVTIPQNCEYIKCVFEGTAYNNDICINIYDADINGKYFPYEVSSEDLSIVGKYFPDGMNSTDTDCDEIRYNKANNTWEKVKAIKSIKLKELSWQYVPDAGYFYSDSIDARKGNADGSNISCISNKYIPMNWNSFVFNYLDAKSKAVALYTNASGKVRANICDSQFTDVASFVASLTDDDVLYYAALEPIITELDEQDFNTDYLVWNGGTEEALASKPSTPLKAGITYGFNAVGKIKELEEKINSGGGGVSKEYVDTKLTELSSEVGKVSEDVEKKVDATYVDNAIAAAITNELNTEV